MQTKILIPRKANSRFIDTPPHWHPQGTVELEALKFMLTSSSKHFSSGSAIVLRSVSVSWLGNLNEMQASFSVIGDLQPQGHTIPSTQVDPIYAGVPPLLGTVGMCALSHKLCQPSARPIGYFYIAGLGSSLTVLPVTGFFRIRANQASNQACISFLLAASSATQPASDCPQC